MTGSNAVSYTHLVYGRLGSGTQNGQPYNGNPNGQNGYYSGQQHQQYYGNQNQYTNPYQQYDYYQGHGQNPNGNGNSHHASKKHSYAKTTALVAAAAILFGVVSGGTMYGVNRAANTLLPYQSSQVNAVSYTHLDVYKRQLYECVSALRDHGRSADLHAV